MLVDMLSLFTGSAGGGWMVSACLCAVLAIGGCHLGNVSDALDEARANAEMLAAANDAQAGAILALNEERKKLEAAYAEYSRAIDALNGELLDARAALAGLAESSAEVRDWSSEPVPVSVVECLRKYNGGDADAGAAGDAAGGAAPAGGDKAGRRADQR